MGCARSRPLATNAAAASWNCSSTPSKRNVGMRWLKSKVRSVLGITLRASGGHGIQGQTHPPLSRAGSQTTVTRPTLQTGLPDPSPVDGSFYNFSRGRFVCNEKNEMAQRYVHYDTEELATVAASALGSPACVRMEKYPDGMYNKAILLTMSDGQQAVAKIPNPNAGQPRLTTASEVATMDFVRNTLGMPTPKVYAWCSNAQETRVGAEYIIMEKVAGVALESVFANMKIEDRFEVTKAISSYQRTWASTSFENYGSLYYTRDLPQGEPLRFTDQNRVRKEDASFSVGPSTARDWNDQGRSSVSFDRGPWNQAERYLKAVGQRELACVKQLSRLPKSPLTLCGPGMYQPTREKKTKAIQCYLDLVDSITPTDEALRRACLWHGDLHAENIFVNPLNPTEVTAIIDWQSTDIAPLFI
ncbi:Hypothetical protein R9X50_00004800 [Acrodontium crateriforme]|uniref:Altered inheritance of mitochondria protein 9, mitochondrial n=1 Tax=Acrodontium crateriforme TaxID=150365 RepID=A0AAQ3LY17_9PEZI|nr:Hypothetical protein R9X50_00004800 [Acrodontium crateriforme]